MTTKTDEQLMQLYALGDMAAFTLLYNRHKGGLYRYFIRQVRDKSLAEDLYQDVWNKVIDSAKTYQPSAKFTTWLYTLAHRKMIDQVRHLNVVDRVIIGVDSQDSAEITVSGEQCVDIEQTRNAEALKSCLTKLPQMQLDTFMLKEEAGLSGNDIALVLGASLEATKSRLRYAYQSLRECISLRTGKVVA